MKQSTIILFFLIVSNNIIAFNYPITPRPLRKLVSESEIIIIGNVFKIEDKKYQGKKKKNVVYNDYKIAKIKVHEILQGKILNDTIEVIFNPNTICPSPAIYYENSSTISFLNFKNGQYTTHALNYGSKTLDSSGISAYKQRILEIQNIFKIQDTISRRKETIEWLVKCSENNSTRWEGVFELINHREFSNDEKNGFIDELTNDQKSRLKKAYLDSLNEKYYDFDLSDLLYFDNKKEIDSILISKLKNLPKEEYYYASEYILRISQNIQSIEIENLLKKYYEVRFEPNKTEERDLIISKLIELIEK